jgi:regulator of ribosome biosynthesis
MNYRDDKETSLIQNARDGIQLLVNQIWSRPTRVVDDGLVAELPPISTPLPREKPVRSLVRSALSQSKLIFFSK